MITYKARSHSEVTRGPAQVLILGGEDGVCGDIVPMLDAVIEVTNPDGQQHPLNVFVGASIVLWEYSQQHRPPRPAVTPMMLTAEINKVGLNWTHKADH